MKPQRTEAHGRTWLSFEHGPLQPVGSPEPFLPGDAVAWPHVAFSTGQGWGELARRYHETVETQLKGANLESTARQVLGEEQRREQVVARLTAWIHSQVRYTSLQFGEAAVVPRQPAETLVRRYGDCKDLSTLLVGLLRVSGIPASVALLRTGEEDVQEALPGFGLFDHSIVYIPGKPALWVDATDAFSPPGQLPVAVQGRLALLAHPETRGLVRTPELPVAASGFTSTRAVYLAEQGPARIVEIKESTGTVAAAYREHFARTESSRVREGYSEYVKSVFAASELGRLEPQELKALDKPLRVELEVANALRGYTEGPEAAVSVSGMSLLGRLLDFLLDAPSDGVESQRKGEFLLPEPYKAELRYRVVAPPGYAPRPLPLGFSHKLGPASYSGEYALEGSEVHATFRFDTGRRRWTAAEVDAFRGALTPLREEEDPQAVFEHEGATLLAAGRVPEALEVYRRPCTARTWRWRCWR